MAGGECLRSDDGNNEYHSLQLAREMLSGSNGRIVYTRAGIPAAIGKNRDSNEAAAEEDIEDDAEEGEECDAPEEAGEDHGEGSIDNGSSGYAFDCLLPFRNHSVVATSCEDCGLVSRWNDEICAGY